jgi:hypothetical protein
MHRVLQRGNIAEKAGAGVYKILKMRYKFLILQRNAWILATGSNSRVAMKGI